MQDNDYQNDIEQTGLGRIVTTTGSTSTRQALAEVKDSLASDPTNYDKANITAHLIKKEAGEIVDGELQVTRWFLAVHEDKLTDSDD